MNNFLPTLLILTLLGTSQSGHGNGGQRKGVSAPKDFSYPESREIIEVERPMYVRATSGTVVDPSGSGITKALVEIVTENRKTRLAATFTNDEGAFSFPHAVVGKHYLKVSMPGFDTLLVTVVVTKKAKGGLKLFLHISN